MKKCPRCAENIKEDAGVCKWCGHDFIKAERVRNRNIAIGIVVGTLLFLCFCAEVVGIISSSAESIPTPFTVETAVQKIQENTQTPRPVDTATPVPTQQSVCALEMTMLGYNVETSLYIIVEGESSLVFCSIMDGEVDELDGIISEYKLVYDYPESPVVCSLNKDGLRIVVVDVEGLVGEYFCSGLLE